MWRKREIQAANIDKPPDITVPGIGLSMHTLITQILEIMGIKNSRKKVNGHISILNEHKYIILSVSGKDIEIIEFDIINLNTIMNIAAIYILETVQPLAIGLDYCFDVNKE